MNAPLRSDVPAASTASASNMPGKKRFSLSRPWTIATIAIGVVVLAIAVLLYGFYGLGWKGGFIDRMTNALPFPAVITNSKVITYKEYRDDLDTLRYYFSNNPMGTESGAAPSESEIVVTVLNRLVYDNVLRSLVKEHNIAVTEEELEAQLQTIAESQGSREEVSKLLSQLYGWDEAQFKEKILKPYIWLTKLETVLTDNGTLNQNASTRADEVLAKVKAGDTPFEDLATEYSEDTSASVGGDLGFFGAGEMVQEFEQAVEALEPGEVSDVVQTQFGYHIIKLEEKVDDPDKGVQYHARHILIRTKTIDEFVNEEIADASVHIWVAGYHWDDTQNWASENGAEEVTAS